MTAIDPRFRPHLVDPAQLPGWLGWSLDFFGAEDGQNPHVDVTLQLDVSAGWARYGRMREEGRPTPSFFAFLTWHLLRALADHPSFNLRKVDGRWYRLDNPPLFVPVAVGGDARFQSLVLEDVYGQDYPAFAAAYGERLALARSATPPQSEPEIFSLAHFVGNLPNLRFTGLTLHWRPTQMVGQSFFYFGQRYQDGGRMLVPLAARLHHACTDPYVLDQLLADFSRRLGEGV